MLSSNTLALLLLATTALALSAKDFTPAFFTTSKPSGFYSIDSGSANSGEILALSDLNGDKYTDYIATNDRFLPTLTLYFWDTPSATFVAQSLPLSPSDQDPLAELMVCDFNADGSNELVVTYGSNGSYRSEIYSTKCESTCVVTKWGGSYPELEDMGAVPFIFDRFSNGSVSLFTFPLSGERKIVTSLPGRQTLYSQPWSALLSPSATPSAAVGSHFAAMVDINGDCFSDLVLFTGPGNSQVEFYTKNNHNNYAFSSLQLDRKVHWAGFADFDGNGALDMFLVVEKAGEYSGWVIRNSNSPGEICEGYGSEGYRAAAMERVHMPVDHLLLEDSHIKLADFNFDGYPDLLGIFSLNSYRRVTVLINQQQLAFAAYDTDLAPLHQISSPKQTCLYDFTESGKLSLLVVSKVTKSDGSVGLPRTSIINNIIEDTLFIKMLPLLPSSSDDFASRALVNSVGVTIQWRLTKLNGDKYISVLGQKSQWNYGSLQPPFSTHGLGRTNNYVEDLTVGYPGYGVKNSWTPVIPNSQLILVSRPEQEDWVLETLLRDNLRVYDMIYVSILCLLGMGLLIVYLNWRENQEDKRDHYNFIQMIR